MLKNRYQPSVRYAEEELSEYVGKGKQVVH